LQRINGSVQAELQQTVSTQLPDAHCPALVQLEPLGCGVGVLVGVDVCVAVAVMVAVAVAVEVFVAVAVLVAVAVTVGVVVGVNVGVEKQWELGLVGSQQFPETTGSHANPFPEPQALPSLPQERPNWLHVPAPPQACPAQKLAHASASITILQAALQGETLHPSLASQTQQ
jgi:hypothetical protein